ncbi:hypothetical protein E2320_009546 [Naja naja]|nr:hypothetical protein E2320_009546 [Naja naja]
MPRSALLCSMLCWSTHLLHLMVPSSLSLSPPPSLSAPPLPHPRCHQSEPYRSIPIYRQMQNACLNVNEFYHFSQASNEPFKEGLNSN